MSILSFAIERIETPTGRMLVVSDERQRLRAVDWEDHEARMLRLLCRHYSEGAYRLHDAAHPSPAARALEAYYEGHVDAIDALETVTNGTEFQRAIWSALRCIPAGETISYGCLAARIGRPAAVRAAGLANGANPIAIVVPCHRVIGADGSLTGYGGGIERKRWLLAHEQVGPAQPASQPPRKAARLAASSSQR